MDSVNVQIVQIALAVAGCGALMRSYQVFTTARKRMEDAAKRHDMEISHLRTVETTLVEMDEQIETLEERLRKIGGLVGRQGRHISAKGNSMAVAVLGQYAWRGRIYVIVEPTGKGGSTPYALPVSKIEWDS